MARIVDLQAEHSITQSRIGLLGRGIENGIPVDPIMPPKISSESVVSNLLNGFTYVPKEKLSNHDIHTLTVLKDELIGENGIKQIHINKLIMKMKNCVDDSTFKNNVEFINRAKVTMMSNFNNNFGRKFENATGQWQTKGSMRYSWQSFIADNITSKPFGFHRKAQIEGLTYSTYNPNIMLLCPGINPKNANPFESKTKIENTNPFEPINRTINQNIGTNTFESVSNNFESKTKVFKHRTKKVVIPKEEADRMNIDLEADKMKNDVEAISMDLWDSMDIGDIKMGSVKMQRTI